MEISHILCKGMGPGLVAAMEECRRIAESDACIEQDIRKLYGFWIAYGRAGRPENLYTERNLSRGMMHDFGVMPDPTLRKRWFWQSSEFQYFVPDMKTPQGQALGRMLDGIIGMPKALAYALVRISGLDRAVLVDRNIFWTEAVLDDNDGNPVLNVAIPCNPGCPFSYRLPDWMTDVGVSTDMVIS